MSENNKAILAAANAAISEGNNEGLLSFCNADLLNLSTEVGTEILLFDLA
jgi:hypothetical protein